MLGHCKKDHYLFDRDENNQHSNIWHAPIITCKYFELIIVFRPIACRSFIFLSWQIAVHHVGELIFRNVALNEMAPLTNGVVPSTPILWRQGGRSVTYRQKQTGHKRKAPNPRAVRKLIWFPIRECNDRASEGKKRKKIRWYGWGTKKPGNGTKKTLSKTGPRPLRISDLLANEKTFQLSMFFLRCVFSRCNKLNVTHIPGARFSITLCFPPVSTVRRLLSTPRLYAHAAGIPGRLHFYPPALRVLLSKKIFFSSTLAKFCPVTSFRLWRVFGRRYCFFMPRKYLCTIWILVKILFVNSSTRPILDQYPLTNIWIS